MADIIPFRGVLYNPVKIRNFADITAPPFDVISEKEREGYLDRHPNNIVWLTLGRKTPGDGPGNNVHTRAGKYLTQWLSDDILKRDESPALYLTAHEFSHERDVVTRYGLIALVGLEPFEKGIVLPHEKTFSKVKEERLEVIKACKANLSPIFSLYPDKKNKVLNRLLVCVSGKGPDAAFVEKNSHRHRLWRITDPDVHGFVSEAMKKKRIYIADGHHRYETALRYREWMAENTPGFSADHPANYVMMYLCGMDDSGVVILPAHRMLNQVPAEARSSLIAKAAEFFDIETLPYQGDEREKKQDDFLAKLRSRSSKHCIGVFMKDRPELYLLTLKPGVMEKMFADELPKSLRDIDVTVLTRLIFVEILGFDRARLDNEKLIAYSSVAREALATTEAGEHDIAFILNPTRIEQVRHVAEEGLIMPNKATYFYPKVITGQVINWLTRGGTGA